MILSQAETDHTIYYLLGSYDVLGITLSTWHAILILSHPRV